MDYESRRVKWYWLLLFLLYCSGVVYLLFQGNPFLYSRMDLRSALAGGDRSHMLPIPRYPEAVPLSPPTFQRRYTPERTAMDPLRVPRAKNYEEYAKHSVDVGIENFDIQHVTHDSSGLYLTGKTPWAVGLEFDGKARWKFRFQDLPQGASLLPILLDGSAAYIVHPRGEVICLDKLSGQIRWTLALKRDVLAIPFLWKKDLVLPTKTSARSGVKLSFINRMTGQLEDEDINLEIKPGFQLTESPDLRVLIATVDNKVVAINPEEWQVQWSQTLTDPIKGPAVAVGTHIFVATLGAKVVKLDGSKKGKLDWEADTVKPPTGAPSYLPLVDRLAILDTSGALTAIDAKTGKVFWRSATDNRTPLAETWSARLKAQNIEEFKMDWLHRGWTIWTPCAENHFCIFTPNKGQLIQRISMTGQPISLPLGLERRWIFLTQTRQGQFGLSHLIEEGEVKKLRAEAALRKTNP